MIRALRHRGIALLWGGQALSAVGDEIYRVALVWLAVGMIGERAGFLAAAQLAALFILSLAGGHWADRWDQRRTMIRVDLARGMIVLLPVAAFALGRVTLPLLFGVAVAVSALSAFFDPALQATIPAVSPDEESRQAATALMGTTTRLARAVGPGLVAALSSFVPMIHFFTVDAASFLVSAASIKSLPPAPACAVGEPPGSIWESLTSGWAAVAASPVMRRILFVRTCVTALWSLAYGLALALAVKRLVPDDVGAFGAMVACYGVGNVLGALLVGNIRRDRPATLLFSGYAWMGLGFVAMGTAATLRGLGVAALIAAIGGPVNDVPYYDLLQTRYPGLELPRIFRFVRACETGSSLVMMAVSPWILRAFPPGTVIAACGAVIALLGALGLARGLARASSSVERP